MSLRIFLDANVLFTAAHNPDGLSRLLFRLHRHKVLALLTPHHAIREAETNLQMKFPKAVADLQELIGLLEVTDAPAQSTARLSLPEDDLLVFSSAVVGRATHFLTGDKKDFGAYFDKPGETAGIRIQTVRAFFRDRF